MTVKWWRSSLMFANAKPQLAHSLQEHCMQFVARVQMCCVRGHWRILPAECHVVFWRAWLGHLFAGDLSQIHHDGAMAPPINLVDWPWLHSAGLRLLVQALSPQPCFLCATDVPIWGHLAGTPSTVGVRLGVLHTIATCRQSFVCALLSEGVVLLLSVFLWALASPSDSLKVSSMKCVCVDVCVCARVEMCVCVCV